MRGSLVLGATLLACSSATPTSSSSDASPADGGAPLGEAGPRDSLCVDGSVCMSYPTGLSDCVAGSACGADAGMCATCGLAGLPCCGRSRMRRGPLLVGRMLRDHEAVRLAGPLRGGLRGGTDGASSPRVGSHCVARGGDARGGPCATAAAKTHRRDGQ